MRLGIAKVARGLRLSPFIKNETRTTTTVWSKDQRH